MDQRAWPTVLVPLLLLGCQTAPPPAVQATPAVMVEDVPEWQKRASAADVDRLQRLDAAWQSALQDARRAGLARQVRAEGRLLEPDTALPRPAPTPGSYLCRTVKLGATNPRTRALQVQRSFFCHVGVEGDLLSITKQTGTERPGGYLWDSERPDRLVFLGSVARGREDAPLAYGDDPERDMVAVLERIGPFRFRLVAPWPRSTAKLEILELTPAPVQRTD